MFIWLIGGFILGTLFAAFFEEIMEWAQEVFNRISSLVRKAWVYIKRVPGAVKRMVRYIKDGRMVEETTTVTTELSYEDLKQMLEDGCITQKEFDELVANMPAKVGELDRDRA